MKWAIFLALALAVSGCQTQSGTGGEVTASDAGQKRGTYIFPDGSVYTVQLKNGVPNGRGTVKKRNGTRYTGQWRNGMANGQGTGVMPSLGITYKGSFRNSQAHGAGTCTVMAIGKTFPCRCNRGECITGKVSGRDAARLQAMADANDRITTVTSR